MRFRPTTLLAACCLASLTACDLSDLVEVDFAAPFPAAGVDLPAFPRRCQGRYAAAGDTTQTLLVTPTMLLTQRWLTQPCAARMLDSLGVPRRPGQYRRRGQLLRVQLLVADTLLLSEQQLDTLFRVGSGRLRRYRGWYYLSAPATDSLGHWQVTRLALTGPRLCLQNLRPDSLRLRALDAGSLSQRRAGGVLSFTVRPRSRQATRQVHDYAGLWESAGDYERAGTGRTRP